MSPDNVNASKRRVKRHSDERAIRRLDEKITLWRVRPTEGMATKAA
jgi:hypothetical protein